MTMIGPLHDEPRRKDESNIDKCFRSFINGKEVFTFDTPELQWESFLEKTIGKRLLEYLLRSSTFLLSFIFALFTPIHYSCSSLENASQLLAEPALACFRLVILNHSVTNTTAEK
uniref:Uncharacterized protein n=1 Tax=Ficus carica TaxID=3494 RepID=A0AA88EHY9_FICCA|nr:hypothetical protein TIFTF001_038081 [Ficus carica]